MGTYTQTVEKIYVAYFNRPGDPSGVAYWEAQLAASGGSSASLEKMYEDFYGIVLDSNGNKVQDPNAEYAKLHAGQSTEQLVNSLYQNLFGRDAEPAGLSYWTLQINLGNTTLPRLALSLTAAASDKPGGNQDLTVLNNKITVATTFTADVNTTDEIIGYKGTVAYNSARDFLATVKATVPDAAAINAAVATAANAGNSSSTYTLTTGQDSATAHAFFASETYFNVDGKGPTLNTGDKLSGIASLSDNSLTVTDLTPNAANANIPAGVTLTNIQNVILNASGNTSAGTGFSTVGYADVRNLTVTTNGDAADLVAAKNGAGGTAVTVSHNGFAAFGTTVVGGTNVTATSVGGAIVVGSPSQGRVPLATEVATGAIVINQNGTGKGLVGVFGGTTVNVTTSSSSNTGAIDVGNTKANTVNTVSGVLANPSGAVTVNTAGTGGVTVFGGANVAVTDTALKGAGAITVGDVARVDADNQPTGNVAINETALIAYNGLAGSSNNNAISGAIGVHGGNNVTIATNAANAVNIGNLGAANETSLNPTGKISVTNTGIVDAATMPGAVLITGGTDVTVSTTGAGVTIGRQANPLKINETSNPTGDITVTETMNGNGFAPFGGISIGGGKNVTVNAKGQDVVIGTVLASAPTGAVTVTQSDMLTGNGAYLAATFPGNVVVDGGTTVTVNTTGGSVTVGEVVGGINTVPSGAVAITRTFSGPGIDVTAVRGGTKVDIATTKTSGAITVGAASAALDAGGTVLKDATLAPTGNVTIVDATTVGAATAYGTGAVNVNTNGATTVSIKGGDVNTVTDIQSTLATGGSNAGKAVGTSKLTTVVIDGQQATGVVAIQSDVLANLSVLNQKGAADVMTITNNTAAHALTLTVGGNTVNTVTVNDAKAGSVTVTDNGTASTKDLIVQTVKATTLTVEGSAANTINLTGDVELTTLTLKNTGAVTLKAVETLTKVASIDASTSTGAVTTSITPTTVPAVSQKFTGGSGTATVTVDSNALTWGDGVVLTGGTGSNDVIVVTYKSAIGETPMGSGTTSVKGFEFLGLGATANSVANAGSSYDASGFSGVTLGAVANAVSISAAAKNASLSITAAPGFATTFAGSSAATSGTADGLTINVNTDTLDPLTGLKPVGFSANTVTANGYENITLVSKGVGSGNNSITLNGVGSAGTGTLTVSGTGKMTVTDNGTTATRFSAITSTDTAAVDVSAVVVSNAGAAIVGGAGALTASGAAGGTEVVKVTFGTTGIAAPFIIGDVSVVNVGGAIYTYTVAVANASAATAATAFAAAITAGITTGQVVKTGGANPAGLVATASGVNLVLTDPVAAGAAAVPVTFSTASAAGTLAGALVGGLEEQVITLVDGGLGATGILSTLNGPNAAAVAFATVVGDSATVVATKFAAAINAIAANATVIDGHDGVFSAVASGAKVTITGGTTTTGVFTGALLTGLNNGFTTTVSTTTINYATANDSFTTGSGGGTYDAGLGGSWDTLLHKYSSGNEVVNLTASTAKVDTLKVDDGDVVTNNGTTGGVTSYTVGSMSASDVLSFTTAGKTVLNNVAVVSSVAAATGAATMAGVLDPSGALLTALGNLTYTVTNGVITFSATGGHSLTEFTTAQLISAAEILVNSGASANKVAAFSSGGNTFVVASDTTATLSTGFDAKDVLVQLNGVSSTTGFGITGAQGALVVSGTAANSVLNQTSGKANSGSASVATYDQTGFSADTILAAEFGTTSTSITNLAPSAVLTLTGGAATTVQAVSISQTGTAGQNSLTLTTDSAAPIFKSISTTGDALLQINPTGATTINSLVDTGGTLTTLKVVGGAVGSVLLGGATLAIDAISASALTTVDSSSAVVGEDITLGATTAIANSGVTFTLSKVANSTITATGSSDTFTQALGAGVVTLTASGGSNTISALSTAAGNSITANGAGDTISVGAGGFTITATGSGDTINIASGLATTVTVGSAATVNIGTAITPFVLGADTIDVTAAVSGGTSASYASTTINYAGNNPMIVNNQKISFAATALDAYSLLGTTVANSQVNVATATSLANALDMAANFIGLTHVQGTAMVNLAANTGKVDWFQYGGDTYVVAMVGGSQQSALDANDIVVKITGMVDLTASTFAAEVLTF